MSTTSAPSRPQRPAPHAADAGYGYDVERVDPQRPNQLGPSRSTGTGKRSLVRLILRWGGLLASALLALVGIAMLIWFVFRPMGLGTSLVAFTAALVPVAIVFIAVWWVDRYTPQPVGSLVYAFVWGAVGSVLLTLVVGPWFTAWISPEKLAEATAQFLGAAIQAPVVEESFKSLGLLLLVLVALIPGRSRLIAGPIDGVVYAALMAGGFAFTENILYFGNSFQAAQTAGEVGVFWQTFLLRGLLSPFAHVSFTALCGLGLGIAAERRSFMLHWGLGLGGLAAGMLLHALWNGSTFFIEVDPANPLQGFLTYYVTVQVPIFLLLAAIVAFLRLRERSILRRQLSDYGRAGWFSPHEVTVLLSLRTRHRAERWAGRHGAIARMAMRDFISQSIKLAMERHSAIHARRTEASRRRERELLEKITADRRLIGALTRPVVRTGT